MRLGRQGAQQGRCLRVRDAQQHMVKTTMDAATVIAASGTQLPLSFVQRVCFYRHDAGFQVNVLSNRRGPGDGQIAHTRPRHPVRLACGQTSCGYTTMLVQHLHHSHAPGATHAMRCL